MLPAPSQQWTAAMTTLMVGCQPLMSRLLLLLLLLLLFLLLLLLLLLLMMMMMGTSCWWLESRDLLVHCCLLSLRPCLPQLQRTALPVLWLSFLLSGPLSPRQWMGACPASC